MCDKVLRNIHMGAREASKRRKSALQMWKIEFQFPRPCPIRTYERSLHSFWAGKRSTSGRKNITIFFFVFYSHFSRILTHLNLVPGWHLTFCELQRWFDGIDARSLLTMWNSESDKRKKFDHNRNIRSDCIMHTEAQKQINKNWERKMSSIAMIFFICSFCNSSDNLSIHADTKESENWVKKSCYVCDGSAYRFRRLFFSSRLF